MKYFFFSLIFLLPSSHILPQIPSYGLKLHLRSDTSVVRSGLLVAGWNDISGNNNHAYQVNPANQPEVIDNSFNGLPLINFNGSTSKLNLPASIELGIQNNEYELFIVARSVNSSDVQFLISGALYEQFEFHLNGSSGARFIPSTLKYLDLQASGTFTDGNLHVFSGSASSVGGIIRVDGIEGGSFTSDLKSSNAGELQIGVRSHDGTYYFDGDIAEVILYNIVLSSTARDSVEEYLADRYNILSGWLPVELKSFSANLIGNRANLNWATETEVNNYGFEIERTKESANRNHNSDWEKIGFVEGSGNSNSQKKYTFSDELINEGNFSYRLKQIDINGNYEYSDIVEINFQKRLEFSLHQNYPNPFNPATKIKYSLPDGSFVTIKVYDILGNEIKLLFNSFQESGVHEIDFDGNELSGGTYIYQIIIGEFLQNKKMILLK